MTAAAAQNLLAAQKKCIRSAMLAARRKLSATAQADASARICIKLANLAELTGRTTIAGYMALSDEANICPFLDSCTRMRRIVAIPRVADSDRNLTWHNMAAPNLDLTTGFCGITEPSIDSWRVNPVEFTAALVPSVAVDRRGNRIGFGRGYYDRTLTLMPHALLIAPVFACQVATRQLPAGPHDMRLDIIVTEHEIIRTGT